MTRILLYSDEPILAKGLESVLRQVEGFDLLPTCGSVASLVEQMAQGSPELVLMDLTPEITFAVLNELKHAMTSCRRSEEHTSELQSLRHLTLIIKHPINLK